MSSKPSKPGRKQAATTTPRKERRSRPAPITASSFPIVGIGASDGGLEAFTQLFQHVPADTGMGFVLVQHLDPGHDSTLTHLLSRITPMLVCEITHGMRVEPNRLHLLPPGQTLAIAAGVLQLTPRGAELAAPHSIDFFLESLARDRRGRAIGVILSGTATDGTLGLEAIKSEGGITFAQDASAKCRAMPRSAVAAGCVDFELPPKGIARQLAWIARHPYVEGADRPVVPEPADPGEESHRQILHLVRQHTGVDFTAYKFDAMQRRISRRVVLSQSKTRAAYAAFLRDNPPELAALHADLLISATSFFRNPEAFEVLRRTIFPRLLAQCLEAPVRIWVPGCSTGQEAYSVAMAFAESVGGNPHGRRLQVFATDLNEALLAKARRGFYPKNLTQNLSPEQLRRFFTAETGGHRTRKELRETVVFARQNILGDPPFSQIDLICCRNVLVYLNPTARKRILPMFHRALNPGGTLFLGARESVAGFANLFLPLDKAQQFFVRKPDGKPARPLAGTQLVPRHTVVPPSLSPLLLAQREADRLTLNQFAPAGVLLDGALQVLQFRGATDEYLEPARGRASFDVFKMARNGLAVPLRAALHQARREGRTVRNDRISLKQGASTRRVTIQVTPLKNLPEPWFLVLFDKAPSRSPATRALPARPVSPGEAGNEMARRIRALESELAEARDRAQALQMQNETVTDDLQASHQEATSANEELQSINEEMETSKEELRSTNDQLLNLNEEMHGRNTELARLNTDLRNLHVSIDTVIVVLDRELRIRSFTPLAGKALGLLPADIGRPLTASHHPFSFSSWRSHESGPVKGASRAGDLEELVRQVLSSGTPRTREVRDVEDRWYSLRVQPYLTADHLIDGAVVLLVDIDATKRSEASAQTARNYAEAILRTTRHPLVILRPDLRVDTANAAFYQTFRVRSGETEGRPLQELGNGQWNIPLLGKRLAAVLPRNRSLDEFEVTHDFPLLGRRTMLLNARRIESVDGKPAMILLAIEDVTERREQEESLRRSEERYRTLFNSIDEGFCVVELLYDQAGEVVDYRFCEVNPSFEKQSGLRDALGRRILELAPLMEKHWFETYGYIARTGKPSRFVNESKMLGRWFDIYAFPLTVAEGPRIAVLFKDITGLRQDSLELMRIRDEAVAASQAKDVFLATLSHELRTPLNPIMLIASDNAANAGLPEDIRADFETIRNSIGLEARLIDDLLDLTRIATGKLQLIPQACDLHAVLRDALGIVRPDLEGKRLQLGLELTADRAGAHGDPVRLQQVFWNVLRNAIHFTPEGGTITVATRTSATGGELVITITDTGCGLAPDDLERIFGTFVQANGTTPGTRRSGGLGLGLAISRRMVELHDGSIHANSAGPGQGSAFVITLPLLAPAEPAPAPAPQAAPAAGHTSSPFARQILVVDDHTPTLMALRHVLERHGYQVRTARSLADAVNVARDHPIEVLISDIGLPDGDGNDLMQLLRGSHPRLQGIALSGYGAEDDVARSRKAGFAEHLTKPVDISALHRALEKLLETKTTGEGIAAPAGQ